MDEAEILLKARLIPQDITVNVVNTSNRKIIPELETKIPELWKEIFTTAKENNQLVFDGESFRLEDYKYENGNLALIISKYHYSVRSPLVRLAPELLKYGKEYTGKGLAVGGFLKTSDNKYIFGKKSGKTISQSKVDIIGGILEIQPINSSEDIFEQNRKEIKEESGIDSKYIKSMQMIGMIFSPTSNIILVMNTDLNISSEDAQKAFLSGTDGEMSELVFVDEENLSEYVKEIGSYKPQALELLNSI